MLMELKRQQKGCIIGGVYLGCILYADDILLLSQSVTCMQTMLNICNAIAINIDLKFNTNKSSAIRIGKRANIKCSNLILQNSVLTFTEEIKYLGVILRKGVSFSRLFNTAKIKYYRSFNALYNKASSASEEVLVNLFKSYCIPIITYACEAIFPTKSEIKMLDKLVDNAMCKIFHTYHKDTIDELKFYFGLSSCEEMLKVRRTRFLQHYYNKPFTFARTIACINAKYSDNFV